MPIRDSLARWLGVVPKASIIGLADGEIPDKALEKAFDDASLLSTYADDAWPYICARILAENGSMPPLRFGRVDREGNFEPVAPDHPLQDLFDNPNPTTTGREFRQLLITYLELVGHSPIEIIRPFDGARLGAAGRSGRRQRGGFELWTHNPSSWRIVANPDSTIRGYLWLRSSAEDIRWTPEQMTYLRWVNPLDRWYGQGRIQAVRQSIMAEEYAAVRDKKLEKNLGVPPGILSTEMPLGDPQAELLQRRWTQAVGGYANAGKIAILGSKTTYQPIAANARDAQWIEQRKWRIQEFGAAFGIPVVILVGMKDATFANAGEAVDYLWEFTLQPRLNQIADMVTQRVVSLLTTEPLVARFDYSSVDALTDNAIEIVERAKGMTDTGVVTIDEIRAILGLLPFGGEVGDRLVSPTTLDYRSQEQILAPPPEPVVGPPPAPTRGRKSEIIVPPDLRRGDRETLLLPVVDAYRRDLAGFFAGQLAALRPLTPGKALPESESIIERAIAILTAKRWRDRIARISEPPLRSSITLGAVGAAETLGVAVSFAIPASEAALQLLTGHLERLGVGIQNATIADVKRVLEAGLRAGASSAELRASLGELFDGYEDWRLDRIARTETTAAYNLGSLGQYRDAGVQLVTVVDGDGDEICAPWNGREHVPLAEAEGAPLGHPNCTRTWIPETEGLFGRERADEPAATRADDGVFRFEVTAKSPSITVQPPIVYQSAPPDITVEAPIVNVAAAEAPIVNVTTDTRAFTAAVLGLRSDMADVKAEIRKPRKRKLVKDDMGRVTGSEDVIE